MKNCKLTNEMNEFLINLELALIIPFANPIEHKWLNGSVKRFRKMDFTSESFSKEISDMFSALENYANPAFTGNEKTSHIFHDLKCTLQHLHRSKKIFKKEPHAKSEVSAGPRDKGSRTKLKQKEPRSSSHIPRGLEENSNPLFYYQKTILKIQ